jgi:hypothetical protein
VQVYRVYFIDFRGQFRTVQEFEAESDSEAMAEAELLRNGETVELWNERGPIARLPGLRRGNPS